MHSKEEVLQAKEMLSERLLGMGARSRVLARAFSTDMRDVIPELGANVHAVGVGRKIVENQRIDELAIRIYVIQKVAESAIPPRNLLPKDVDGITCDVIESPPAFIQSLNPDIVAPQPAPVVNILAANCSQDRRKRQRAFGAGISVAHRNVTAGTIGYFCRSRKSGESPDDIFILSNNHVLANVNQGVEGDEVLQPGPLDGGLSSDLIARLHRFVRIRLGGDISNPVDAAIAKIVPDVDHNLSICGIGGITGTELGVEEMRVLKHGRTTGLTEGVITDESVDQLVGMSHTDPSVVGRFERQLRIERAGASTTFGEGGDSGSLVVSRDSHAAVGLYFAGPDSGIYGLANPIGTVLDELEIELIL